MESAEAIYALGGDAQARDLARLAPLHDRRDAADPITRFRLRKSAAEIALIRKATDATVAAHRAAWKRMKPGLFEYQIAATMLDTYLELGVNAAPTHPLWPADRTAWCCTIRRTSGGSNPGTWY